jgi:hypothetical protein
MELGHLHIERVDERVLPGTSLSGASSSGEASLWSVTGPPGVKLTLADVNWTNGEQDVRALEAEGPLPVAIGGPRPLERLLRGGRLAVLGTGSTRYVELQIMRINPMSPEMWSSSHKASDDDFVRVLGEDWHDQLRAYGPSRIGTRESVLDDITRRRAFLCVAFERKASPLPIAAYCLTRVLPLLNIWSELHPPRAPLPNQRRVYVVRLDSHATGRLSPNGTVYVGETGRTPEERLLTHKAGGRTSSRIVLKRGVELLPWLYEHIPPIGHEDHRTAQKISSDVEKWLSSELVKIGYRVEGGTRGIHEAPFADD